MVKRNNSGHSRVTGKQKGGASAQGSADLLFEIGVEELPYQFVAPALLELAQQAGFHFGGQRLSYPPSGLSTYGTPRRLVLVVKGLKTRQAPSTKEFLGPSKKVAFDQSGQPTKAAVMFAAGKGVPVESLQVKHVPERGDYVVAIKEEEGRPTNIILCEVLPKIVEGLSFPKAMKWNDSGVRFARPIRWVLAMYGGAVLPIEVAGVKASDRTTGHRVIGGGKWIHVNTPASYEKALKRHGVMIDPKRRRQLIKEQIETICRTTGFRLNEDEALLDQAVYSTELPTAIIGSFNDAYLALPEEILVTSMKEHQGFFSLRHKETGKLAPHFIAVANSRVKDMSRIREGNERVLAARLADAKFFFDEDRKISLDERVKKLSGVVFHQKLGTMAQKQERVRKLAGIVAGEVFPGQNELRLVCDRAAALSKADLVTGIVGEFPELQGIMGGEYAKHDGESEAVSLAIRDQYLPNSMEGAVPKTTAGQILALADRLDSVVAFFHAGIVPTGSEDPFALRRHATAIVRIIVEANLRIDVARYIQEARNLVSDDGFKGLPDSGDQGLRRITDFILDRVRHYCRVAYCLREDVIEAVLEPARDQSLDLVDLVQKMKALETAVSKPEFDSLMVGFKRVHRLVDKERWVQAGVDPGLFQHAAEVTLHDAVTRERTRIKTLIGDGEYDKVLDSLGGLKPAIDGFFSAVMVNSEDKAVRGNRLSLLKEVDELFMSFADFSQIVVQGTSC